MWKRMFERGTIIPASILIILSMSVSWVLVYKFGWRFTDPLGLATAPFADNESYFTFGALLYGILVPPSILLSWFIPSNINSHAR